VYLTNLTSYKLNHQTHNLQGLLTKDEQPEIDEVGGQIVEEDDAE